MPVQGRRKPSRTVLPRSHFTFTPEYMVAEHRILVVEDHVDTAEAFAIIFEARGLRVSVASNGQDALQILRNDQDYCAILLDLMMPGMDGRAFRREQRADARLADIPVIIVSGDPTLTEAARQMGVSNFLKKPIDPVELVKAVERQCGDLLLSSTPAFGGHVTTH